MVGFVKAACIQAQHLVTDLHPLAMGQIQASQYILAPTHPIACQFHFHMQSLALIHTCFGFVFHPGECLGFGAFPSGTVFFLVLESHS